MKNKKRALLHSAIALLLCVAMLVGSTYAWFTDGAVSNDNIVQSGGLDIKLHWALDLENGPWVDTENADGEKMFASQLWEPGHTEVRYFRIQNAGDLAFQYAMQIVPDGSVSDLAEVIDVYYLEEPTQNIKGRNDLTNLIPVGTLAEVIDGTASAAGVLLPVGADTEDGKYHAGDITVAVALKMQESAGNEYQGMSIGSTFNVVLHAAQYTYEEDAFGSDYDAEAELPFIFPDGTLNESVSDTVNVENGTVQTAATLTNGTVSAEIPAGVKVEGDKLTLTVTDKSSTDSNVTLGENEELRSLDVHVEGVAADNAVPMTITLEEVAPKGLNAGNLKLYHVENGTTVEMTHVETFTAHNQFQYDPATGTVTLYMATFSEVSVVADTVNAWNGTVATAFAGGTGTETDPYIIANADQLAYLGDRVSNDNTNYSSAYYKLIADINIGGIENYNTNGRKVLFYPIGYNKVGGTTTDKGNWYTYGGSFTGEFDGAGHTITGIYQNTWAMVGDYSGTYYNDAMGLFGYVNGGAVKNLTIDNFYSEGEFAPTGCVAAYAAGNATFENIAITGSHPQTYNTGVAGIVGWDNGGDTEDEASKFTFKNITVDSTNTISALWGSWDVAAAGLLGYLGEYSKADLTNCNVAATIDVYNDVCGNYQYYWYRYCGMMIGTVDKTDADGNLDLSNITAIGCTVDFGDRHEYYYCEFVKNSLASYTHDHQFSRISHSDLSFTDGNGNGRVDVAEVGSVTGCTHDHVSAGYETKDINGDGVIDNDTLLEDKQAVHIPFRQIFGGYGWGVDGKEIGELLDIQDVTPESEPDEDGQVKFDSKFTGDFLYRVGNANKISVGSLFEDVTGENVDINTSGVYVRIDKKYDEADVTCEFVPNANNWEQGTLKFTGTGVVDIVIQDYDYCKPTVLHLEIVDAWNITFATSAPYINNDVKYDVVLLNNVENANTITVSDGYSFYGNGFTLNYPGDGSYGSAALSYGFVTVKTGGTLDNVKVMCKIFPKSYLYTSEMTTDANGRYPYGYSAIVVSGNSTISNCYVYGARNNISVGPGNVMITNTITECGSLSNIQIKSDSGNVVTLDDVTTIQYQTTSPFDSNSKVLGFGVMVGTPDSASNPTIKLTGNFVQDNWVTEDDTSVSNSYAKSAIESALKVTKYQHTNSSGKTAVNTGIAYLNALDRTIKDERSNSSIVYEGDSVSISGQTGYVYSIANKTGNPDAEISGGTSDNADMLPAVIFTGTQSDSVKMTTSFETMEERWVNTLMLDLDNITGGAYSFSFNDLVVRKYGVDLAYTVKDSGGNTVDKTAAITVNQLFSAEYTLVVVDNQIYGEDGLLTGETKTRELPFILYATKNSIDPPEFTGLGSGTAIRTYEESFDLSSFSYVENWRPAYTALEGVSVTYWSSTEGKEKSIDLSTLNMLGKIDGNVWIYTCDDYTLTITGGQIHTDETTIYPIVVDSTLYFASTNKAFGIGTTSRDIILTYVFTDNNASTTMGFSQTVNRDGLTAYEYSDFKNGNLTVHNETDSDEESGSTPCVTPDTLITLADGTQKHIDSVTYADQILVWDFVKGEYTAAPPSIVMNHGAGNYTVVKLNFSDGTVVKTINGHGFFEEESNKFIILSEANAADYVGHSFVKQDGSTAKLVSYEIYEEYTESWSVLTSEHYNCILEGMLTITPAEVEGSPDYLMPFTVGEDMRYDAKAMVADIEKYGLYTYEEFADYMTYEQFTALNLPIFKVAVGKGYITWDEIMYLVRVHIG